MLVRRRADPNAGVVDQHVEPAEALAVAADHLEHAFLLAQVGDHGLHLEASLAQLLRGLFERVGLACADRQGVALFAQHIGQGVADAARGSGDDRGTLGHRRHLTDRAKRAV